MRSSTGGKVWIIWVRVILSFRATACSLGNSPGNLLCMQEGKMQFGCKVVQAGFCHN